MNVKSSIIIEEITTSKPSLYLVINDSMGLPTPEKFSIVVKV